MDSSLASSAATASGDPSPLLWAALPVAAYLVGSFPTAHLLARSRGVDLGAVGSKNYGATNLGRTLGRSWGILCFAIDATKGALPVVLGGWLLGALGAPSGGVTTATAWCWRATARAAILAVSRIISLASMVAAISIPCSVLVAALAANGLAGVRAAVPFLVATGVIAAFVVWKHRSNIARMRAGTEPKVGAKKPAGDGAASPEMT